MKRSMIVLLAAASLTAAAAAYAGDDEAALEKRIADAQRRLEDAAREIAELSGEAAGPAAFRQFQYFLPDRRRAMLGVNLGASEPNGGGIRVESVSPGGPAAEAGVKPGDVVVAVAAKPVTTGRELVRAMESVEPGEKVELGLRRDGKEVKLAVQARAFDFPAAPALPAAALPALAAAPFAGDLHWLLDDWGDAEFVTLTPGLGHYFGTEKGVLVAHAPEDSTLGLEDGDVIIAIGGREPQNGRHAMRILRSYQPGEAVEIRILRNRRERTLSVKVPERAEHGTMRPPMAPRAPAPPVVPAPPAPANATAG